jgi:MoaA/NifB/PqqE/SkfB family radical SAM enzyme
MFSFSKSHQNYWKNLIKLARNDNLLHPLLVIYLITTDCNLNCKYCEDFGARLNSPEGKNSLDDVYHILEIIRSSTDHLVITGGEPLTFPHIDECIIFAKEELKFKHITLLSNGFLLSQHENILPLLDRLVISLDSMNPGKWHQVIKAPVKTAERIIENIKTYAAYQDELGFQMIINCVLTPDTLDEVIPMTAFCEKHHLFVSFSPQAVRNWPHYDLLISQEYKTTLDQIRAIKKEGGPILGSHAYYQTMANLSPYKCFPTLAPRVMPNGDLIYPCRPIEKEQDSHGGSTNLINSGTWDQAMTNLIEDYDQPPIACTSCFQQCYAEPSLMQSKPFAYSNELLRFAPSRKASLASYTPG